MEGRTLTMDHIGEYFNKNRNEEGFYMQGLYKLKPELALQIAVIRWLERQHPDLLERVIVSMAGVYTSPKQAALYKAAGNLKGRPDLFFPIARQSFHGLMLELKAGKNTATKGQREFHELMAREGQCVKVVTGFDETIRAILIYFQRH